VRIENLYFFIGIGILWNSNSVISVISTNSEWKQAIPMKNRVPFCLKRHKNVKNAKIRQQLFAK
jgi:hypothetical protein